MTVYGYLRVSTDKQDCDNQKLGVEALAKRRGLVVDKWIEDDGVSGTKEPEKRALGGVLKKLKKDDVILCSELSRLGRKLFMIMRILEKAMSVGAHIFTEKENYELGDNVQSKVLAFAFGLVAELEREMISKRTKEALQRLKAEGKELGRRGIKNKRHKVDTFPMDKFKKLYLSGMNVEKIAKILNFSTTWLYNYENAEDQKRKEVLNVLKFGRAKKRKDDKKEVVRLSDFKMYKTVSDAWNDNFIGKVKYSQKNRYAFIKSIREGEAFNGLFFEFKDFYDGVENDGNAATETL